MINLQGTKQSIINIEYGWNNPKTLIILVPIVSLISQRIHVSHLHNILKATYQRPEQFSEMLNSREMISLDSVYKWHALGSTVQTIVLLALLTLHPLILVPTCFSLYEMWCSAKGITSQFIVLDGQLHIQS